MSADAAVAAWRIVERRGTTGPRSRHASRFGAVGADVAFGFPPGPSFGERYIHLGRDVLVGPGVALTAGMWPGDELEPVDDTGWVVRIGDGTNIGRHCSIAGRVGIDIGPEVTIGPGVFITDHNHEYADPTIAIMRQWIHQDRVTIGPGCWLGVGAVILPGTTLGANVAVAAGSVVRGRIPDRCVVAGAPARVVRRWDADTGAWDPPLRATLAPHEIPPGWYEGHGPEVPPLR